VDLLKVANTFPAIRSLAPREFDVLVLNSVEFPEKSRRMLDISQGAKRARCCDQKFRRYRATASLLAHFTCLEPLASEARVELLSDDSTPWIPNDAPESWNVVGILGRSRTLRPHLSLA